MVKTDTGVLDKDGLCCLVESGCCASRNSWEAVRSVYVDDLLGIRICRLVSVKLDLSGGAVGASELQGLIVFRARQLQNRAGCKKEEWLLSSTNTWSNYQAISIGRDIRVSCDRPSLVLWVVSLSVYLYVTATFLRNYKSYSSETWYSFIQKYKNK